MLCSVTNGNCLWQLQFPDVIGFLNNGYHQSAPISISATLHSKYCSAVPQGHAIQSDWMMTELMYATCLLFIMGRGGSSGKLTSVAADTFISK